MGGLFAREAAAFESTTRIGTVTVSSPIFKVTIPVLGAFSLPGFNVTVAT